MRLLAKSEGKALIKIVILVIVALYSLAGAVMAADTRSAQWAGRRAFGSRLGVLAPVGLPFAPRRGKPRPCAKTPTIA